MRSINTLGYITKRAIAVGCLVAAGISGIVAGKIYARINPQPSHHDIRLLAIKSKIAEFPAGGTILIGDSIVEQAYVPTLCDKQAFNAGIAGDSLSGAERVIDVILKNNRPGRLAIQVGLIDSMQGSRFSIEEWGARFDSYKTKGCRRSSLNHQHHSN